MDFATTIPFLLTAATLAIAAPTATPDWDFSVFNALDVSTNTCSPPVSEQRFNGAGNQGCTKIDNSESDYYASIKHAWAAGSLCQVFLFGNTDCTGSTLAVIDASDRKCTYLSEGSWNILFGSNSLTFGVADEVCMSQTKVIEAFNVQNC